MPPESGQSEQGGKGLCLTYPRISDEKVDGVSIEQTAARPPRPSTTCPHGAIVSKPSTYLIVGVGASAGGIEAIQGFFRHVPSASGAAFVVVTHLSPERESMLHEIIARYTALPVQIAADGMRVEPDHVYVMPGHAILGIKGGHLTLRKGGEHRERKPIDIFLSALAVDMESRAVGVILSGGDADGTLGLKAIKERGGMTLAQTHDGFGPQHSSMPDAAIGSGLVDFALPAENLGEKIVELARLSHQDHGLVDGDADSEELTHAALPDIYNILRNQVGHDFSGYKTKTFIRRVHRRMQIVQMRSIQAYLLRLQEDAQEVGALFRDLLINVTNFFRDNDAFDALASSVIPKLFEGRGADDTVRIWVPGCATGEEAYSIGILVREYLGHATATPRVQIFATDIDDRALSVARAARYPEALLESVSAERRKRFFTSDGGAFVVAKEVRELCVFSPHSVVRDPPFSRIDLVSCRNLLIYFGVKIQNQVIPTFHYALRPNGFLFLGTSENVTQFNDLFAPIEKRHRIFRRRSDVVPNLRLPVNLNSLHPGKIGELVPRRNVRSATAMRHAVDQQVLDRFSPPHVVVNRDGDVVYFSSRTGKYLEAPPGAPTRQLLTMARRDLRLDLRTLFREAVENGRSATREGIAVEMDEGRIQMITLTIEPLSDGAIGEPFFLVLFLDQGPLLSREEALERYANDDGTSQHMERELHETRDRLQSMIEEYETALEELKSSNEELVSVNEEMQSTNEELEASKEELQSVNEELHTVNAELNGKVDALDRANSDLLNLFESTNVATVFLDSQLVIRSFTPAVASVFNVRPSDCGRPITDLSSRLDLGGLSEDIGRVFKGQAPIERRVNSEDNAAHFLVRVAPYEDSEQKIRGVVLTFLDITSIAGFEARQQVLISELQHRTRNLLTLVQSTAQKTLGKTAALDDFTARLAALSRVQSLVGGHLDEAIDLGDIVRLELDALSIAQGKVSVSGPQVLLNFDSVQTFGLALHELATNAVKYGALRGDNGRLDISWTLDTADSNQDRLSLDWIERGVSIPEPPQNRGFGRELLERALAFTLRAETKLVFGPDGVMCHIEMPLPSRRAGRRVTKDAAT